MHSNINKSNNNPIKSKINNRHSKCYLINENSTQLNTQNRASRTKLNILPDKYLPGTLAIAQIRSLPLNLSELRSERQINLNCENSENIENRNELNLLRSSYVVNLEKLRFRPNLIKRTRSLSPNILSTTAKNELKSPKLVMRSTSECSSNARKNIKSKYNSNKSWIPLMINKRNFGSSKSSTTTMNTSIDNTNFKSGNTGNIPINKPSKSRLFFNKLLVGNSGSSGKINTGASSNIGKMDYQSQSTSGTRNPKPSFEYSQSPERSLQYEKQRERAMNLPRQKVVPLVIQKQDSSSNYPFRRPTSSASSLISEPIYKPHIRSATGHYLTRQTSGPTGQNSSLYDYDDDPGIMSEIETSSTGFRRGNKIRSSLPVVRTPSKTLERPMGLVFLQYRTETKRAILPNEITSLDTVKALFVRSFPRQLTLEYLELNKIKIYIHDNFKELFYELDDLRDIRDRTLLRLFEPNINGNGSQPRWETSSLPINDASYFSEPEYDTEYLISQQHVHKTKTPNLPQQQSGSTKNYAYNNAIPGGATMSLPRNATQIPQRPFSPNSQLNPNQTNNTIKTNISLINNTAPPKPTRNTANAATNYTAQLINKNPRAAQQQNIYSTLSSSGRNTPNLIQASYQERSSSFPPSGVAAVGHGQHYCRTPTDLYSSTDPQTSGYISSPERSSSSRYNNEDPYNYYSTGQPRSGSITPLLLDEQSIYRMENMERQLINLTGLVEKALSPQPIITNSVPRNYSNTLPRNHGASSNSFSLVNQGHGKLNTSAVVSGRDYIPGPGGSITGISRSSEYRDESDDKNSSSSSTSMQDDTTPKTTSVQGRLPKEKLIGPPVQQPNYHHIPKFGKEKSVSFSDDPVSTIHSSELIKQNSLTHSGAVKPSIKSFTLPRGGSSNNTLTNQEQGSLSDKSHGTTTTAVQLQNNLTLQPFHYNQLRSLQRKAKELKMDVKMLRRSVQVQVYSINEIIKDTFIKFKVIAMANTSDSDEWSLGNKSNMDPEKLRLKREENLYKQEMLKLDTDLTDLERTVENLRSLVINKKSRVNMSDVENMALVLSKSSKSIADLKTRFPLLSNSITTKLHTEMEKLMIEEQFLKNEPEKLELILKRCKKLTGTLVTLKRLASVQEQRLPNLSLDSASSRTTGGCISPTGTSVSPVVVTNPVATMNRSSSSTAGENPTSYFMVPTNDPSYQQACNNSTENQLDALLNELSSDQLPTQSTHPQLIKQTHLKTPNPPKRLPSYPSTESGGCSPIRHPPLPPKPTKIPPLPPPRSSSKIATAATSTSSMPITYDSESSESLNSQDGHNNSDKLNQRHLELLRKQKLLQDQYLRLQSSTEKSLKKTGSEGNLKIATNLSLVSNNSNSGSMTNLVALSNETDIL